MSEIPEATPSILFVCVENSCRSQMAEGLTRLLAGDRVAVRSAGSTPSGVVNPRAIDVMAELGYDLSTHSSTGLEGLPVGEFDAVVTMGCGDACPQVPARLREDWQIPDPKDMPLEAFREIRDDIGRRVGRMLRLLGVRATPSQMRAESFG